MVGLCALTLPWPLLQKMGDVFRGCKCHQGKALTFRQIPRFVQMVPWERYMFNTMDDVGFFPGRE